MRQTYRKKPTRSTTFGSPDVIESIYGGCQYECYDVKTKRGFRVFCRRTDLTCKPDIGKSVCSDLEQCLGRVHRYAHPSVPEGIKNDYTARYKLVGATELITSHDPTRHFAPDPRYPHGVQDRDYQNPRGQDQIAVIRNASKLDPDRVINTSLTSSEGPPIVEASNLVLSGNSRAMAIRIASQSYPKQYKLYWDKLVKSALIYGFTSADVLQFRHVAPVLVREVVLLPGEIAIFASLANKPVSRELDPIGKAIELSKLIPNGLIERMELDEGETLRSYLSTSRGRAFVDMLSTNSAPTERGELFAEGGGLTDAGKAIIENALFAKIFDERTLLSGMSDQAKRALEYALPDLLRAKASAQQRLITPAWDIVEAIKRAVGFVNRNLKGVPLEKFLRQTQFVAVEKIDFDTLWGQVVNLLAQHGTKPRVLKSKLAFFIREAEFEYAPKIFQTPPRSSASVMRTIVESAREEATEAGQGPALFGRTRQSYGRYSDRRNY